MSEGGVIMTKKDFVESLEEFPDDAFILFFKKVGEGVNALNPLMPISVELRSEENSMLQLVGIQFREL